MGGVKQTRNKRSTHVVKENDNLACQLALHWQNPNQPCLSGFPFLRCSKSCLHAKYQHALKMPLRVTQDAVLSHLPLPILSVALLRVTNEEKF